VDAARSTWPGLSDFPIEKSTAACEHTFLAALPHVNVRFRRAISGSEIKLVNRIEGSVLDSNGGVNVQASLVTLARNGWLEVERRADEIRIRLGRRAKDSRSPEERKS
jgi:hypothetical protein